MTYAMEHDKFALDTMQSKTRLPLALEYARELRRTGKKANGEPLTFEELDIMKHSMEKSVSKANLHCSIALMLGIVDEHDILEEGEVLVGNGKVVGPVLIFRSPCLHPGNVALRGASIVYAIQVG